MISISRLRTPGYEDFNRMAYLVTELPHPHYPDAKL